MSECLLDVCDINHSDMEDYTPNISKEYHVKKVVQKWTRQKE